MNVLERNMVYSSSSKLPLKVRKAQGNGGLFLENYVISIQYESQAVEYYDLYQKTLHSLAQRL